MCDLFGGASSGETNSYDTQTELTRSLQSNYAQQYAQQQNVLQQLGAETMRIQSGQTGPGFGGAENAAETSQIVNQGAAQARNAIQAERTRSAGVGGGGTSSLARSAAINRQISGGIEALAGANTSNALLAQTAANYQQGRTNANTTAQLLGNEVKDYNPEAFAQLAGSSNQQQFSQAHEINEENIAAKQAELGTALKIGTAAATFGIGGIGAIGPGESFGEGASDFLKGGFNALSGSNFSVNNAAPSNPGYWG